MMNQNPEQNPTNGQNNEETKVMQPVQAQSATPRRRRADRNRELLAEQEAAVPAAEAPHLSMDGKSAAPAADKPVLNMGAKEEPAGGTSVVPRFQSRMMQDVPPQGVPRPASLGGTTRRPAVPQTGAGAVRRPLNAEGYVPIKPLGSSVQEGEPSLRTRRPEMTAVPSARPRVTAADVTEEFEEPEKKRGGKGLVAVIIALLLVAAVILGLMMIPDDDQGVLGQVKRTVTAPLQGLLGSKDAGSSTQAQASGFSATPTQDTAPYKIAFTLVTSNGVKDVRVVDAEGKPMPTTVTSTLPSSENSKIWMFEMTLETEYSGVVQAQILDGESWLDTGLQLNLNTGASAPGMVSSVPTNTAAAAETVIPTGAASTLTADSSVEPTVSPDMAEIPAFVPPMDEGTSPASDTAEAADATEQPAAPTAEVSATPTMSVTATPTVKPTATPTAEPTLEPTATPTLEPTPTPTLEPTATPVVTPRLEAMAHEDADPSLIAVEKIYVGKKQVDEYERAEGQLINMPAGDDYLAIPFGVATYRGDAFRQNAAYGTVTAPESMSVLWTVEAGKAAGSSRTYYGIGWTGQPAIVRWATEIRDLMDLSEERTAQVNLKEVIIAGLDGNIYFLDLNDGTATRDKITFGYPMRGTPSIHPMNFPLMTVGQYARKMKNDTSKDIGLYYYNLVDQKKLRLIDGLDRDAERLYYEVGAFDTSALFDRSSNTLVAIGTNGMLYTEKISPVIYQAADGRFERFEFEMIGQVALQSRTKGQKASYTAVESSLAMYGSYAFYADMDGILRCVDTTTMTTAWAVDTGDAVKAAISLELDEESGVLWLYTANTVTNRTKGDVTIRRFNAMTGEQDWAYTLHCAEGTKKDVTNNAVVTPGAMASAVVGRNDLSDLVYYTLSSVSKTGGEKLTGEKKALSGVVVALSKASGEVVWYKEMDAYCYSSPVAVYDAEGYGWLIQACSNGTLYLMDGLTGETVNTLSVKGVIEGSPAVYGNIMVIGTTGKDSSYIYGIRLN